MIAALEVRVGEPQRIGDAINVDLVNLSSHGCDPFYRGGILNRSGQLFDQLDDAPDYRPGRGLEA